MSKSLARLSVIPPWAEGARTAAVAAALGWLCVCAVGCGDGAGAPASAAVRDGGGSVDNPDAGAVSRDAAEPKGDAGSDDCCEAQGLPICADPNVQECVCAADPSCCSERWDIVCVQIANTLGCAECKGNCCAASPAPGCAEDSVERCVCAGDESCCASEWDDFCVLLVESLGCGTCQ